MSLSDLIDSNLEYNFGSPGSFPDGVNKSLFFNSDIKKKNNGGEAESLILLFF